MARIAIYGATGYTGNLVAAQAIQRGLDVVLLGRNKASLAEIPGAKETRVAGLDDIDALASAFEGCNVVLSCVAPFSQFGAPVLAAAIQARAHYVDVSGDMNWVKRVHEEFGSTAKAAGVVLLPAMTDDGLPGDLIARILADRLPDIEKLQIHHGYFGSMGMSKGSIISFTDFVKAGPLHWEDDSWHRGSNSPAGSVIFPGTDGEQKVWSLAGPELIGIQRHSAARHISATVNMDLEPAFSSITNDAIQALPRGPSEDVRSKARLVFIADGVSANGNRARVHVNGQDPYLLTAVASVEIAARLSTLETKNSGAVAPSEIFDAEEILKALSLKWEFES